MFALLVIALIFYVIAKVGLWFEDKGDEEIRTSNTTTIGTIIKTGSWKGSYAIAEYWVNGKRYERKAGAPSSYIYTGEHYIIMYQADKPFNSLLDFTRQVFLKDEVTDSTTGTIVYKDWATVEFNYNVNGRAFRRWQKYPEGKKLSKGETYTVEYLVDNPNVSILKIY
ncbi:MAG TPA: hypothetical protein VM802_18540 [Chitinophaga sp.]|uniref:hypothetical protein n=1 Tax=Chitinophaga sp. TaxID=1869181 RepID=UPI002C40002F|nr:hypothetical protein [Chitinophaga sp.]HVI46885.1 hypothetical protein [Chitinophaga sp.]